MQHGKTQSRPLCHPLSHPYLKLWVLPLCVLPPKQFLKTSYPRLVAVDISTNSPRGCDLKKLIVHLDMQRFFHPKGLSNFHFLPNWTRSKKIYIYRKGHTFGPTGVQLVRLLLC